MLLLVAHVLGYLVAIGTYVFWILPNDLAHALSTRLVYLATLLGLSAVCGAAWVVFGSTAARWAARGPPLFRRLGAGVVGPFACLLAFSAFRSLDLTTIALPKCDTVHQRKPRLCHRTMQREPSENRARVASWFSE
jgi:hypothetical protein